MARLREGFEYLKQEDNRESTKMFYEDKKETKNEKRKGYSKDRQTAYRR